MAGETMSQYKPLSHGVKGSKLQPSASAATLISLQVFVVSSQLVKVLLSALGLHSELRKQAGPFALLTDEHGLASFHLTKQSDGAR